MEDNEIPNKKEDDAFLERYDTVLAFLSLEVLCLGSFALGGSTGLLIFRILGFFLSLITTGYLFRNFLPEEKTKYWIRLIPFIVLCLLLGVSRFFLTNNSSTLSGLISGLAVSVGLFGFFLLGQGVKSIPSLKKDIILLCLGGTLALMAVIPGLYSLIRYGFFYAQRYKGMVYYYDGVVFKIADETKALNGFSFAEISLSAGKFAAFLLSLAAIPAIFISPKKDAKRFLIYLAFGLLGLIDLLVVPFWKALILVLMVYVLAVIYRVLSYILITKKKAQNTTDLICKIIFYVLIGLVATGVLVLVIDALTDAIFSNFPIASIRSSRSSGILSRIAKSIRSVFWQDGSFNFLGILFGVNSGYADTSLLTRVFEISIIWENGFLAFFLFLFCAFFALRECRYFLSKDSSSIDYKVAIVALLLGLFLYGSLFNDEFPYRHSNTFAPWSRSSYPLLACFLCGLIYTYKHEEVKHE